MTLKTLSLVWLVALTACTDTSSHLAKTDSPVSTDDSVVAWARAVDSVANTAHPREFSFPARSTEGGAGRFYRFADSSVRIDIDDLGEMGKRRTRFYARGATLRLAVGVEEKYDRPMSGNVAKTLVDSTWFVADTAVRWHDSTGVVHVQRDSTLRAHGTQVFAEYLTAIRVAAKETDRRSP